MSDVLYPINYTFTIKPPGSKMLPSIFFEFFRKLNHCFLDFLANYVGMGVCGKH